MRPGHRRPLVVLGLCLGLLLASSAATFGVWTIAAQDTVTSTALRVPPPSGLICLKVSGPSNYLAWRPAADIAPAVTYEVRREGQVMAAAVPDVTTAEGYVVTPLASPIQNVTYAVRTQLADSPSWKSTPVTLRVEIPDCPQYDAR